MFQSTWHQITSPLVGVVGITGVIGIAAIVIGLMAPSWLPITRQNLIWFGIVMLAGGAFYFWAFRAGERHNAYSIAIKDKAAITRAVEALKEVDECINGGGTWDDVQGSCVK